MSKNKNALKRKYGRLSESLEPYMDRLDLRSVEPLDDEAFAFISSRIRGVNMLDIAEADITANSLSILPGWEYIYELRIKDCPALNDTCIEYLNQLHSLHFLQLKATSITVDGILLLDQLTKLKELQFTVEGKDDIRHEMDQLRIQLPNCSFYVNSKPWIFG